MNERILIGITLLAFAFGLFSLLVVMNTFENNLKILWLIRASMVAMAIGGFLQIKKLGTTFELNT